MPSQALQSFLAARHKARRLSDLSTDKRLRPLRYEEIEPPLHASLAAYVSGWEIFVESITLEFLDKQITVSSAKASLFAKVLRDEASRTIARFNTLNFNESRDLILRFTGFDPLSVMNSSRLAMTSTQVQTRLNEILKVRHSFAHGHALPPLAWLTRYAHQSRLSKRAVRSVEALLGDLSENIDRGLAAYAATTIGGPAIW
jgi:hypothetical protein